MKSTKVTTWKKLFLGTAVLLTGFFSSLQTSAQTWTPYNYWTFDGVDPLGDSLSHNALNATYFSSPYTISPAASPGVGKYLTLNTLSRDIEASSPFNADTSFTLEFLFKPASNMFETTQIFRRRDGAIGVVFGYPFIRFTTGCQPTGSTNATYDDFEIQLQGIGRGTYGYYVDGNWHHLVFKYNATTGVKEVWVDGESPAGFSKTVPAGVIPPNTGNTGNNICDLNTNATYYLFLGSFDEIAIYKQPLSSNMIYQHYQDFKANKHYSFANSTSPERPRLASWPLASSIRL